MKLSEIKQEISLSDLAKDIDLSRECQVNLIRLGFLDPPADGRFGSMSAQALKNFRRRMRINESGLGLRTAEYLIGLDKEVLFDFDLTLASKLVKYMLAKNYFVAYGKQRYNIIYLEGANADGTPNNDPPNEWRDRRIVFEIPENKARIIGNWAATTEPGLPYTIRPLNPGGAFRIAFDQFKAWQIGTHKDHEALVQRANVRGHRDFNKDGFRTGDRIVEGVFGINQHWGGGAALIGNWSAGCLVGQLPDGHREFMRLIKQDERYQLNKNYMYLTTIIAGDDLAKFTSQ